MPRRRRRKKESQPMNIKSMIAVGCLSICGCLLLFILWYYYPYHSLQFFVDKTDIDQEHYTNKLLNMNVHPKYTQWVTRHNKNNQSLNNISSINNNYNPFNIDNIDRNNNKLIEININKQNTNNVGNIFLKYLQPLCIKKNILSHDYLNKPLPTDCNDLLDAMINITTHHVFNDNEINALSQRIEYLMHIIPQNGVYLFIHIPHTAIQSIIINIINNNKFKQNEILHYDDNTDIDNIDNMENIKLMYGHLPYGFDKMFISKNKNKNKNESNNNKYILNIDELEQIENGDDENGKLKDLWINKLNFTYYTVLRDPIDFIVANYYDGNNKNKYKDLDDFIEHKSNRNIQTKYVSGSQSKINNDIIINGNDYIIARNNLLSMGWIGLFHDLQNSVNQLKYFWKLNNVNKINMKTETNKNFDKPFNIKLSLTQHQTILKRNKWDIMLYELAIVLQKQQEIVIKYKFS